MLLRRFLSCLVLLSALAGTASAAVWQWSVPVPPSTTPSNEKPRAFLWIPENCARVNGLVFGHHNMEEEALLEHPVFRQALTELGFAVVWVAPSFDRNFRFDEGAGERFEAMLNALATLSGYTELYTVPLVPVGHSAAASMPWYIAAWKPERVLAGISFSGQWPYAPDPKDAPHVQGVDIDSVPGLVTMGEYEWANNNIGGGLKTRINHPSLPLSGLGVPADGHFFMTDEKAAFIALYLKKAAAARLPKNSPASGPVKLNAIDVTKTGWLVDRYRQGKSPLSPAAPVGQYKGKPSEAFWFFDGELAQAAEKIQSSQQGKPALLGFVQDGVTLPQKNGTHQQVSIGFKPEADGVTFRLSATFLDTVPEGRPEKWAEKKAGETIEPPTSPVSDISVERITGPIRRISADTWELSFNRSSFLDDRRGNEAWLAALWQGNGTFKRAVQQGQLSIPRRNTAGAPQKISFELPSSLPYGPRDLELSGTSDSGLPVRYLVREGPAEIVNGTTLRFLRLPPRSQFPVTVTVVAWQFGRNSEPKIQSAAPVERTLLLTR